MSISPFYSIKEEEGAQGLEASLVVVPVEGPCDCIAVSIDQHMWLRNVEMQLFKAVEDSELMAQSARRH